MKIIEMDGEEFEFDIDAAGDELFASQVVPPGGADWREVEVAGEVEPNAVIQPVKTRLADEENAGVKDA